MPRNQLMRLRLRDTFRFLHEQQDSALISLDCLDVSEYSERVGETCDTTVLANDKGDGSNSVVGDTS